METTGIIGFLVAVMTAEIYANCFEGCKCTTSIEPETLTVNCTKAALNRIPQELIENTYFLIISDDNIPTLKKYTFNYILAKILQILSLQRNNISKIEEYAFVGLTQLEALYLSQNSIERLGPNIFYGLSNVKSLSLSDNKIIVVDPGAFEGMGNLVNLRLAGNHIQMLSPYIFVKNSKLRELCLTDNLLSLPTDMPFLKSKSLRILNMSYCQLNDIPPTTFQGTPHLQQLDLGSNDLTNISNSFENLTELVVLNLEENEIEILGDNTFKNLYNLQVLYLNGNRLHHLHKTIFEGNPNIMKLKLNFNYFSNIDASWFSPLIKLVQLDLYSNPLQCDCKLQMTYVWCLNQNITALANCKHSNGSFVPWTFTESLICVGENLFVDSNIPIFIKHLSSKDLQKDSLRASSWNIYILIIICILTFLLLCIFFVYVRRRYRELSTPNAYDVSAAREACGTYNNFPMGEVTSVIKNSKIASSLSTLTPQSTLSTRYSRSTVSTSERSYRK